MATTVTMPQLGETVTEGTILRWAKNVGDTILEDEVLVEISTDKVDTEMPSPAAGTILEILVPEGETVAVGAPLVVIGAAGEEAGAAPAAAPAREAAPAAAPEAPAAVPPAVPAPEAPTPAEVPTAPVVAAPVAAAPPAAAELGPREGPGDGMRKVLSPVVRKLAKEHGLDLTLITGTGQGGRITRKDVLAFIERPAAAAPPAAPAPAAARPAVEAPAAAAPPAEVVLLPGDEVRELDRLRARIGANMIQAKRTAAHVWTAVEVDYERVERVRQAHRAAFKEKEGYSLTYLPFIARAAIDALKAFPVVNSSFYLEASKAVFHEAINLGIAVDVNQQGLVVTTIRDADGLRMVGLARRVRELAQKARDGKLDPDDVAGSTFTITNPGPFGSFMSAPIINVPNVAILSTDTVVKRPAVITTPDGGDMIAIRHIGYLGLTWDHRAFDGSTAVLFLRRVKENLETWDWEQELA